MPYGTLKVDNIIFTNGGVDQTITVSGIVASTSGDLTVTGTISGNIIRGGTTVSGATVTGSAGQFGNLTAVSGTFTTISGGTYTLTSGVFASGTAANPSISFVSDPNTGIYSSGADEVAISTNGTGRLFVDASGNVGVGTAPSARFHVSQVGNTEISIGGTSTPILSLIGGTATDPVFGYANGALRFGTVTGYAAAGFTERLRLDSSGRLGLGTSTPQGPIEIQGSQFAYFRNNCTGQSPAGGISTGMIALGTNVQASDGGAALVYGIPYGASGFDIASWDGATYTRRFRIDNSGQVGIGTTSPVLPLHVVGSIASRNTSAGMDNMSIQFNETGSGNLYGVRVGQKSNAELAFEKYDGGWSETARIDSAGRLLVGTSSSLRSAALIQIAGASYPALDVNSFGTTTNPEVILRQARGTQGSPSVVVNGDSLGKIGFQGYEGANYYFGATIEAYVDAAVTSSGTEMPSRLVFSTTADGASSPTERMRITNDGRLLVGYTSSTNSVTGVINAVGYAHKQGTSGAPGTSAINFFWTGNLEAWVDTSNVGNVTLVSDYRIKKNIQTQTSLAIPRLKQLRPVTYERANYETLFTEDGVAREGFIAHEVAAVIPSGVEGEKDAENRIQSLNIDAIVSVLTKALQEAIDKIESLEARLAAAGID